MRETLLKAAEKAAFVRIMQIIFRKKVQKFKTSTAGKAAKAIEIKIL